MKTKIRQIFPTVFVAFIAGYFFKWLAQDYLITGAAMTILFGAIATISTIFGAFILGERQVYALWKVIREADQHYTDKKHVAILAMTTAAQCAMVRLDDRYQNTHQDRMRIRIVYHGDTFASLIEAIATIPLHTLGSAEASFALAGLKKNMIEAQHWIDQFIASKNRSGDALFPESNNGIDLRACKINSETHYRTIVRILTPT